MLISTARLELIALDVRQIRLWAKAQNGVSHVIAETYLENAPSQNILRRCGFVETKRGESVWWRF